MKVCVASANLRAIAKLSGRVRVPVLLFRGDTSDMPLASDSFNPTSAKDRARFHADIVEQNPDVDPEELRSLFERLAVEVVAATLTATHETSDPFPTVEPWPETVQGAELLNMLTGILRRYVGMPRAAAHACALWIVHTWVPDVASFTPYLLVSSPVRACGKSTLLDVLEVLAARARRSDGITAAALLRITDKMRPTMLLDELDTKLRGDGGETLRGVLNSGFQSGGRHTMCVGDSHEPRDFRTFGPKVLAGIGRVWDTVESRSIPIRLSRATAGELRRLRKVIGVTVRAETSPAREKCARWTADNRQTLEALQLPPVPPDLSARQADIWRPLLAIADVAGGRWPVRARAAAVSLHGFAESETDHGLQLLYDLEALFVERACDRLRSAAIVESLCQREDRPWPEMPGGRPLSARGVASLLSRFGVRPTTFRDSAGLAKGYTLASLAPVFTRYLPAGREETAVDPIPDVSVTAVTAGTDHSEVESYSSGYGARSESADISCQCSESDVSNVTDVTDSSATGIPHVEDGVIRHPDGSSEFTRERLEEIKAQRAASRAGRSEPRSNDPQPALPLPILRRS